jgi:cobalamin biosynthesis protein CobW
MPSRRVAACVITGFLGSGKTTLLRGLLERAPSPERIAVVVNEVGEIGIDGRVLAGFELAENVVELASGCVCCSIDEFRFDLAVDELVRRLDPALLVIETSGVADPGPTLERLRRCGVGVDAVVTVVDARAWKAAWRVSAVARRQVRAADFLVVSKGDLVTPHALAKLRATLSSMNPRARVLEGAGAAVFPGSDLLLATSASAAARSSGDIAHSAGEAGSSRAAPEPPLPARTSDASLRGKDAGDRPRDHLADEDIETFAWTSSRRFERQAFEQVLRALPREVLRAKGLLARADGRGAWLFQVVCGRVELTAFEGVAPERAAATQGVFIGPGIAKLRDRIVHALESAATKETGSPEDPRSESARDSPHDPVQSPPNDPADHLSDNPASNPSNNPANNPANNPG